MKEFYVKEPLHILFYVKEIFEFRICICETEGLSTKSFVRLCTTLHTIQSLLVHILHVVEKYV